MKMKIKILRNKTVKVEGQSPQKTGGRRRLNNVINGNKKENKVIITTDKVTNQLTRLRIQLQNNLRLTRSSLILKASQKTLA